MSLNEGFAIRKPNEDDLEESPDESIKREGEESLLTASGVEIGWVLFDEGHYCDKQHLQKLTFFLPVVRRRLDSDKLDGYQGLLLQFAAPPGTAFKKVGVGAINDIGLFDNVAEQVVGII
jgi:hypothetical protein